jgi:hypothetical protein
MQTQSMTAALGIIKVGGIAIGKMKTLRCTESIRRVPVGGIGQLHKDELDAVDWDGMLNCSAFAVDLRRALIPGSLNRQVQNVTEWETQVLLQEDGITIDIMRKVKDTTAGGLIIPKLEIFCSIRGCFSTQEGWDLTDGQVAGRDANFQYTTPFIFPL